MISMFPYILIVCFILQITDSCTPFSKEMLGGTLPMIGVPSSPEGFMAKARGQSTHLGNTANLGLSSNPPVRSVEELTCFDFDQNCKWRNMEGLFIDELDWFQGSGVLDQGRLQVATGTSVYPDGMYAIVATDTLQLATTKAVLVSDVIECQRGAGVLRFMYWTSPEVHLKVCTKSSSQTYPDFSYCSPIVDGRDPGPAVVSIPDQSTNSFQLYIIADNFVFQAVNLQGGFAIIDNLEYDAEMCASSMFQNEIETFSGSAATPSSLYPTLGVRPMGPDEPTEKPFMFLSPKITRRGPLPDTVRASPSDPQPATTRQHMEGVNSVKTSPDEAVRRLESQLAEMRAHSSVLKEGSYHSPATSYQNALTNPEHGGRQTSFFHRNEANNDLLNADVDGVLAACEALTCSFNLSQPCVQFAESSSWMVSPKPVGNPLTGIRGDASELPFRRDGSFSYVAGPRPFARFTTAPFYLDRDALFVFSYHKVDRSSNFRLYAKRNDISEETIMFEAPRVNKDSRRWFREGRDLPKGQYDYLVFEVRDLDSNNYIGVDEWMIVDQARRAFCL